MAKFLFALIITLKNEGKYTGLDGGTMYGITKKVARANGYQGDMHDFPLERAKQIYYMKYWKAVCPGFIESQLVANQLFDQAVNGGVRSAGKIFQKAINRYNSKKVLKVDGSLGVKSWKEYKKIKYRKVILNLIKYYRIKRYIGIGLLKPWKAKYLRSWVRRV